MNNSLFKISQDLLELFDKVEEQDGELTDEQAEFLEIKEGELQQKASNYMEVINQQDSFVSRIDDEIKRLQAIKKQRNGIVTRLKNNLLNAVHLFGEFEVGTHTFGLRKSTAVEVDDVNGLAKEYKTIKVTEQADKKAIKEAIKGGEVIDGCRIVTNQNLKIK